MSELASAGQLRMGFVRWALVTVPACVVLGFISGAVSNSGNGNRWYDALEKPDFLPPPIAFPIAWTILYVMLGIALAMVLNARGARGRGYAIALFVFAFALNLTWSPVFFGMHMMTGGLVVLALMFAFTIATAIAFARIRRAAAWLLVPYLGWLCFATALNWSVLQMNPGADGVAMEGSATQIDIKR